MSSSDSLSRMPKLGGPNGSGFPSTKITHTHDYNTLQDSAVSLHSDCSVRDIGLSDCTARTTDMNLTYHRNNGAPDHNESKKGDQAEWWPLFTRQQVYKLWTWLLYVMTIVNFVLTLEFTIGLWIVVLLIYITCRLLPSRPLVVSTQDVSGSADERVAKDDNTPRVNNLWTSLFYVFYWFTIVEIGLTLKRTIGEWIAFSLLYIIGRFFLCRREAVSTQAMSGSADQRDDDNNYCPMDDMLFKELSDTVHAISQHIHHQLRELHREKIRQSYLDYPGLPNLDNESEVTTGLQNYIFYRRSEELRYGLKTKPLIRDWFDHRLYPNTCPSLKPAVTESDAKKTSVGHQSSSDATINFMSYTSEDELQMSEVESISSDYQSASMFGSEVSKPDWEELFAPEPSSQPAIYEPQPIAPNNDNDLKKDDQKWCRLFTQRVYHLWTSLINAMVIVNFVLALELTIGQWIVFWLIFITGRLLPSRPEVVYTQDTNGSADQRVAEEDNTLQVIHLWTWVLYVFTIVDIGLTLERTIGEWIAYSLLYIIGRFFLCRREEVSIQVMSDSAEQRVAEDDDDNNYCPIDGMLFEKLLIGKIRQSYPDFPGLPNLDSESGMTTDFLPRQEVIQESIQERRRPEGVEQQVKGSQFSSDCGNNEIFVSSDALRSRSTREIDNRMSVLKSKGLEKVIIDGQTRFVIKKSDQSDSAWAKIKRFIRFCFRWKGSKRLVPQKGCDDIDRPEVHKPIEDQDLHQDQDEFERELEMYANPPLRDPFTQLSEEAPEKPFVESRRLAAADKHKVLKNSIETLRIEAMEEGVSQIAREGFQTLATKYDFPSAKVQKQMCQSLSSSLLLRNQNIKVSKFLGRGSEGFVFKGKTIDKRKIAIKLSTKDDESLYKEHLLLKLMRHESVIHVFEMGYDFKSLVVMEFAKCDLLDFIVDRWVASKHRSLMPMQLVRSFSLDIARGLEYIHSKGYVHNDIKMENVLIVDNPNGKTGGQCKYMAKVSDFGFAQQIVNNDGSIRRYNRGYATTEFAAPECLVKRRKDARLSDIWAFGVIVYRMITYHSPFPSFSSEDKKGKIKVKERVDLMLSHDLYSNLKNVGHITAEESTELQDIMKCVLEPKVSKRQPMYVLVGDKWFEDRQRSDAYDKARRLTSREPLFMF